MALKRKQESLLLCIHINGKPLYMSNLDNKNRERESLEQACRHNTKDGLLTKRQKMKETKKCGMQPPQLNK